MGYGGDQEAGKLGDVKMGNDGVGNSRNQDNRCATVEDVMDSDLDAEVTNAVDLTD